MGLLRVALPAVALTAFGLSGCQERTLPANVAQVSPNSVGSPDVAKVYQPLAVGDSWTFTCNHQFKIVDRVLKKTVVNKRAAFALALQIPSSPTKSTTVVQLLANDVHGNTWIYGYLNNGKTRAVTPTEIVAASPVLNKHYDYPGPAHGTISRIFKGFEWTNKTPLGVFWVAPYFESGGTHNYGYALGRGVMEEDHGPHYQYDCLIEKVVLH